GDGGVIVWGVDARRGPDDADVAQDLRPISQLMRFLSDLETLTSQLVAPAAQGVVHLAIEDNPGADTGYVATLVPRGEGEPIMAIGPGQHTYYQRAGGVFLRMEHFQVADRFHRRPQPNVDLDCRLVGAGGGG